MTQGSLADDLRTSTEIPYDPEASNIFDTDSARALMPPRRSTLRRPASAPMTEKARPLGVVTHPGGPVRDYSGSEFALARWPRLSAAGAALAAR